MNQCHNCGRESVRGWAFCSLVLDRRIDICRGCVEMTAEVFAVLESEQSKRGLEAVLGAWPGHETDEEVKKAMRELGIESQDRVPDTGLEDGS